VIRLHRFVCVVRRWSGAANRSSATQWISCAQSILNLFCAPHHDVPFRFCLC
jgi:hypothetical protein